jgi:hypothetical protein
MVANPEGWHRYVEKNYTLVYVFKYDEAFKSSYGRYFDILKNDQLYRVEKIGEKLELRSINSNSCQVLK